MIAERRRRALWWGLAVLTAAAMLGVALIGRAQEPPAALPLQPPGQFHRDGWSSEASECWLVTYMEADRPLTWQLQCVPKSRPSRIPGGFDPSPAWRRSVERAIPVSGLADSRGPGLFSSP